MVNFRGSLRSTLGFPQLATQAIKYGTNVNESGPISLFDSIREYLPKLPKNFSYADDVTFFNVVGNIEFHTDMLDPEYTLFVLLHTAKTENRHGYGYDVIIEGKNISMIKGDYLLLDHTQPHAVMTETGWLAMAVSVEKTAEDEEEIPWDLGWNLASEGYPEDTVLLVQDVDDDLHTACKSAGDEWRAVSTGLSIPDVLYWRTIESALKKSS